VTDSTRSTQRFLSREDGATLVEYALVLAFIVIGCLASVSQIGNVASLFFDIGNTL
jgi:pilus assembly protein Flp/PilA